MATPHPSPVGTYLGPYRILGLLGSGGMGEVYRAHDPKLARDVAVKVVRPDLLAHDDRSRRFAREARTASALNHPNIVTIHDIGHADGVDFIVMEYVSGQSLDTLISSRGVPVERALLYAAQIASALAAAHAAGVVHRDIKPANVIVTADGHVKVLDFGVASLAQREVDGNEATRTGFLSTVDGRVVGTPAYMSPEQAQGLPVDPKSDVFSLGVVLYEMLAGHRPFTGPTPLATLTAVVGQAPLPVDSGGNVCRATCNGSSAGVFRKTLHRAQPCATWRRGSKRFACVMRRGVSPSASSSPDLWSSSPLSQCSSDWLRSRGGGGP